MSSASGIRLYNLFPLLAGPLDQWDGHLDRIAAMGFSHVYVNPIHEPGASGSLYAIRRHDRLHPLLGGGGPEEQDRALRGLADAVHRRGLGLIVDLVVNHVAQDSPLVVERPDWFRREADGSLRPPRAVDPVDPRRFTVWSDLAEIDYIRAPQRDAQVTWFKGLIHRYLGAGVDGFRCDAAYQVPAAVWMSLLVEAHARRPGCLFLAETLGCTPQEVERLAPVGFDWLFNSAKWWDFKAPWLLEQYERYRTIAPSIAFPESHDTQRLAAELAHLDDGALEHAYRFAWLWAASFSAGVMMPMGFEYGFRRPLHVVDSRPEHWEDEARQPRFDLTGYVGEVNRMRAAMPALNAEGPLERLELPDASVLALLRDGQGAAPALIVINADPLRAHPVDPQRLWHQMALPPAAFVARSPSDAAAAFLPGRPVELAPLSLMVLEGERAPVVPAVGVARPGPDQAGRVAIEKPSPEIDGGRFPAKRVVGDVLTVEADIFTDGHDKTAAAVLWRHEAERAWQEAPMVLVENDRWTAQVPLTRLGRHRYTIQAWRDPHASWRGEILKKLAAGQSGALETREGVVLVERAARAAGGDARVGPEDLSALNGLVSALAAVADDPEAQRRRLLAAETERLLTRAGLRLDPSTLGRELEVVVDRRAARFAAWYEMFPRSQSGDPSRHGTFRDVIGRLPYVRELCFDVLYFTPIHPIGRKNRKGRNNSLVAQPGDPGSPYAIGAAEGGHDALHPELGSFEDFHALVAAARAHGLEIAMDIAIQCSPDHPWLTEHPEWFDWRPDGSLRYAENPPKKGEDIVNVRFDGPAFPGVWLALRDVILFWIGHGVTTFRVDSPHTKSLPFWEWMIRDVQTLHPEAIFLSEAFTRSKMMKRLAKLGFTQSYTYFTWRTAKYELIEYLTELTQTETREFFRPNFFINTPDINPKILQSNNRAAYLLRFVLAATLSSVYGIYNGYEICEGTPVPHKEEYLDSEKYELKAWDFDRPGHIRDTIALVNRLRRRHAALQETSNLTFYNAFDENILLYGKRAGPGEEIILIAVNLDPDAGHGASFEVPLWEFGLPDHAALQVEDLVAGHRFQWHGKLQHLWLDIAQPFALWRLIPPGQA